MGPLLPLLFVMTAKLLQYIVNKAARVGILFNPLGQDVSSDFPVV